MPPIPSIKLKKEDGKYKIQPPELEMKLTIPFITQIHQTLGHIGQSALINWFLKRNIKAPIRDIKSAINACTVCKGTHMFRTLQPPRMNKPYIPNQLLQIDFIGPLKVPYSQKYACTLVDVNTGILAATASSHPDANTTLRSLNTWMMHFGPPQIIDQGSHFTATSVQKLAAEYDIDWNFHLSYNPTAAGTIERHNGLLKHKMQTLLMDNKYPSLQVLLNKACLLLNSRPRQNRPSPLEQLYLPHIENINEYQFIPPPRTNRKIPYKILTKNSKDNSLSLQEIIADSGASLYWTVNDKGELQQTKIQNTQPRF